MLASPQGSRRHITVIHSVETAVRAVSLRVQTLPCYRDRMCNLYTWKMTAEEMRALKLRFQLIATTCRNGRRSASGASPAPHLGEAAGVLGCVSLGRLLPDAGSAQ